MLLRLLRRVLLFAGIVALIAAGAGFVARWIHSFDLLASIGPHLSVSAFLAFAVNRQPIWATLGMIAVASSLVQVFTSQDNIAHDQRTDGPALKVVTYNATGLRFGADAVLHLAARTDIDILVFVEAGRVHRHEAQLRQYMPHMTACASERACSVVILSRHPLQNIRTWARQTYHPQVVAADISIAGKRLTIFGADIRAPRPSDRQFRQFEALADLLAQQPGPMLVAGDLNAAGWSPGVRHLTAHAGLRPPYGIVASWPSLFGPLGVPLDHVLVSDDLTITSLTPERVPLRSDHRPVGAVIAFPHPQSKID